MVHVGITILPIWEILTIRTSIYNRCIIFIDSPGLSLFFDDLEVLVMVFIGRCILHFVGIDNLVFLLVVKRLFLWEGLGLLDTLIDPVEVLLVAGVDALRVRVLYESVSASVTRFLG